MKLFSKNMCFKGILSFYRSTDFSFPTQADIKPHLGFHRASFTGGAIGSGKAERDSEKGLSFGVQEMWL